GGAARAGGPRGRRRAARGGRRPLPRRRRLPGRGGSLPDARRGPRLGEDDARRNDTHAALRSGTDAGWGVAVVCGAGINCTGVAPDGREARFPSLGEVSGDWGGGFDVGKAAVWAAARSEDGRGPKTSLERSVPAYFGLETPYQLAQEIHAGRVPQRRATELAPLVLQSAEEDE